MAYVQADLSSLRLVCGGDQHRDPAVDTEDTRLRVSRLSHDRSVSASESAYPGRGGARSTVDTELSEKRSRSRRLSK